MQEEPLAEYETQNAHSFSQDFVTSLPDRLQRKRKTCAGERSSAAVFMPGTRCSSEHVVRPPDEYNQDVTASKKPLTARQSPQHHGVSQPKQDMQSLFCTTSCSDAAQHKPAIVISGNVQNAACGNPICEGERRYLSWGPASAMQSLQHKNTRQPASQHLANKELTQLQTSQPVSVCAPSSMWSLFVEHDKHALAANVMHAHIGHAACDDDDSNEIVTAMRL